MESSWSKLLGKKIDSSKWEDIYLRRVKDLPDNKLSEFLYKIIHNLVMCRSTLYKWKRQDSPLCPVCKINETIQHIYFDCKIIKAVWKILSTCLKVDLTWEKILFGFIDDITVHRFRNFVCSITMYSRFKYWVATMNDRMHSSFLNILIKDLSMWGNVIEVTRIDKNHRMFKVMMKTVLSWND